MRTIIYIVISIFITTMFNTGCNEVDMPYPESVGPVDTNIVWDDSSFSTPNNGEVAILMEEFTGHTCNNCPEGAEIIDEIKDIHGDRFISIGIHASEFAEIKDENIGKPFPDNKYTTDFRTPEGTLYYEKNNFFNFGFLPGAMIQRIPTSGNDFRWGRGTWKTRVQELINSTGPAVADVDIITRYDDSSSTYEIQVDVTWLEDVNDNVLLQVYHHEDNVVDWQLDGRLQDPDVPDYNHRHVFRGAINGEWGQFLQPGVQGETETMVYQVKYDNADWDINNFSTIAFIYIQEPGFEILQANEAHYPHP